MKQKQFIQSMDDAIGRSIEFTFEFKVFKSVSKLVDETVKLRLRVWLPH